jgi:hypothetical protein
LTAPFASAGWLGMSRLRRGSAGPGPPRHTADTPGRNVRSDEDPPFPPTGGATRPLRQPRRPRTNASDGRWSRPPSVAPRDARAARRGGWASVRRGRATVEHLDQLRGQTRDSRSCRSRLCRRAGVELGGESPRDSCHRRVAGPELEVGEERVDGGGHAGLQRLGVQPRDGRLLLLAHETADVLPRDVELGRKVDR